MSVVLLSVAPTHQSPKFVFTEFITDQAPGVSSRPYIFLLGLLSAGFTLVGKRAERERENVKNESNQEWGRVVEDTGCRSWGGVG